MRDQKFFICKHCGNLIGMIDDRGVSITCCGAPMEKLEANTADAAKEKHVPVAKADKNSVKITVSSAAHPMTPEHYISWIYLQTEQGGQRKGIGKKDVAEAEFFLAEDDAPVAVFAYCNLHGLWKASF